MDTLSQPISPPITKRHYRSAEERRRIVEETLVPGTSVAIVARAHGVNANQVFGWRKLYHSGLLGSASSTSGSEASTSSIRLLPVSVCADTECQSVQTAVAVSEQGEGDRESAVPPGVIELTLAQAQVRITGDVAASVLRVLLECLRG